ncbi:response regulator transcription factor [Effusibacillus dendaii]|uniref:HTH luxR-type domain-containing protein n=1 Tax=Effusibacillus dendaii TaxID=2743772 RepID=A0A7I8DEH9_9BACL|nr:LuxR C-terminal-related transcriptional regulator [Effusibacillus dendaii]BCJ88553.1 hypothetical protein skT53_35380 [Effusibacillus dendaii]
MVSVQMKRYIDLAKTAENHEEKLERLLRGFVELFPFDRASLYAYSPLSHFGQGLLGINQEGVFSIAFIQEDVRRIPPIYRAIQNLQPQFALHVDRENLFPDRYVQEFRLSSLAVVPISHNSTVVGCALMDRSDGKLPSEPILQSLYNYGTLIGETVGSPVRIARKGSLSKREIEVLQRMSDGDSIKGMAVEMGISEYTVREYIQSAMRKMGVQHRAQAVAEAIRHGMIR